MMDTSAAGAGVTSAPASSRLKTPTLGDWIACGDIQKTLMVADRSAAIEGKASLDMVTDPEAVRDWLLRLTDMDATALGNLPLQDFRALFIDLNRTVPLLDGGQPPVGGRVVSDGIIIPLAHPIADMRGTLSELHLRQPRTGDWINCGDINVQRVAVDNADMIDVNPGRPVRPQRLEMRLDRHRVNRWLLSLSNKPEPILHGLNYADARNVFAYLKALITVFDLGN